jgi:hypothetical protein
LVAGTTIGIVGIVFYYAWYSRGGTAASISMGVQLSALVTHTIFAFSSVWSASLSLGELGNYIFVHPSRPILHSVLPIGYALAFFAAGSYAVIWLRLRRDYPEYLRFVFWVSASYSVVLVALWTRGAALGIEERYFRLLSLLLLVGMVHAFVDFPGRILRSLAGAIAAVGILYGLGAHAKHVVDNLRYPLGIREFRHSTADAAVIDYIRKIDGPAPDRGSVLIFVSSPEIALEVRNVRVMATHADPLSLDDLRRPQYRGRVPHLYVIVQKRLVASGKVEAMLRSFLSYSPNEWKETSLGDFVAFHADE